MGQHYHCAEFDHSFVIFNGDEPLSMEPVDGADLEPIRLVSGDACANAAWSSDCRFYFIVMDDGIALLSVASGRGYFCRKKSARFIEMFLTAPIRPARKRQRQWAPKAGE